MGEVIAWVEHRGRADGQGELAGSLPEIDPDCFIWTKDAEPIDQIRQSRCHALRPEPIGVRLYHSDEWNAGLGENVLSIGPNPAQVDRDSDMGAGTHEGMVAEGQKISDF